MRVSNITNGKIRVRLSHSEWTREGIKMGLLSFGDCMIATAAGTPRKMEEKDVVNFFKTLTKNPDAAWGNIFKMIGRTMNEVEKFNTISAWLSQLIMMGRLQQVLTESEFNKVVEYLKELAKHGGGEEVLQEIFEDIGKTSDLEEKKSKEDMYDKFVSDIRGDFPGEMSESDVSKAVDSLLDQWKAGKITEDQFRRNLTELYARSNRMVRKGKTRRETMKVAVAENGRKTLKLSHRDWQNIGLKAGWLHPEIKSEAKKKKLKHSPTEHGFIDECIEKNKSKDDPGAYCASIVDKAKGTTSWRGESKK